MMNLFDSFFGPITRPFGKDMCGYFYFLMILGVVTIFIQLINIGKILVGNYKKLSADLFIDPVIFLVSFSSLYFTNRMFYSMCMGSLN